MKCLLVYGTLSGSTMTAAEVIANTLKTAGHEVDVVSVESATKDSLASYDAFIVGSPSWEDEGKDGQPLPEVRKLVESFSSADLTEKKVGVFGLGDISYPHFCGAVDVLEEKLKAVGVTPVVESLRIDRYYSQPESEQKVVAWATNFSTKLVA